jgi:ADP-heptose:LPS heptosyltransferase
VSELHTVDFHLSLVEPLGIHDSSTGIKLQLPAASHERAKEIRGAHKIDNPFVIFHPGSARVEKFWDAQRWADVIDHARAVLKLKPVLTSGSSAFEQKHVAEIKGKLAQPIVDLSGKIDLLTLTALIEQARMIVTVDTAPMHLAAAMHTPQVVLFGPTNPFHWRPRESSALVLQGRSTSPVVEFTPDQPRHSMNDVSTEAVISAMNSLLSTPAAQVS